MFLSFSRKSSDFLCPHADNLIFPIPIQIPFPLLLLPSASFLSKTPDGHKKTARRTIRRVIVLLCFSVKSFFLFRRAFHIL